MIADFLLTLVLAAASGCGIGGGGLLVAYLTLFRDVPQKTAQAANLLFFLCAAGVSAAVQMLRGTLPPWKSVLITAAAAIPGVVIGSALRNAAQPETLRLVFGVFLVLTGLFVLLRGGKNGGKARSSPEAKNRRNIISK